MGFLPKGTRVIVRAWNADPWRVGERQGLSYGFFQGTLLEDCNGEGWDVVDILTEHGNKEVSVYSFSVERR